jgi:hypothetical protein
MANELEERLRIKRARRNRRRFFSLLGFLLLLIYVPALWNWLFSKNHEIGVIKTATLEIKVPVNALFIRNEKLLLSPEKGIILPNVQYGERVARGGVVASYVRADMKAINDSYKQMEIEILKRVVAKFDQAVGIERELWEDAIEAQMDKLTAMGNARDLSDAESIRAAIDNVLEAKARYMLDSGMEFTNEKKELERLRSSIEQSVTNIRADFSAVVSYTVDGYEESLTPETMNQITLEKINEIMEKGKVPDKRITPPEIAGKEGEPFGKLVMNDVAWIALSVPEQQGRQIAVLKDKAALQGKELTLELEVEGVSDYIPVTVETIGQAQDGNMMVTVRMDKYIEKTMDYRASKGNLVIQSITGMKVPIRSLFNINSVDDTADIAIVYMNKAVFRRVKIVGRQDSYAIIENVDPTKTTENVNIFDIYLVNPNNIVEGQVIEK